MGRMRAAVLDPLLRGGGGSDPAGRGWYIDIHSAPQNALAIQMGKAQLWEHINIHASEGVCELYIVQRRADAQSCPHSGDGMLDDQLDAGLCMDEVPPLGEALNVLHRFTVRHKQAVFERHQRSGRH